VLQNRTFLFATNSPIEKPQPKNAMRLLPVLTESKTARLCVPAARLDILPETGYRKQKNDIPAGEI